MNQALLAASCVRRKEFVLKVASISLPFLLVVVFGTRSHAQSVGISSTAITPAPSSILELRTSNKGLLMPRLTTTERDAISSPATGLVIYNTTTNLFNFYNGTAWTPLASGAGINSLAGTTNRISVGGTSTDPVIDISGNYVGQTSITTVGTIGTGTWNGTTIAIANGGTGQTSANASLNALLPSQTSNANKFLQTNGTNTSWVAGNSGTVTSASVVSANGFAGTVATSTTTPALTLSTTVTGMLKGNGTALSAATSGTDYSAGTAALSTGILKSTTTTGALSIAVPADFPTLNQNTTGSAGSISGTNVITAANQVQMAANTIKGNNTAGLSNELDLTVAQTRTMLSLNNVENTALSTWTGSSNITTLGTIGTGTWNGTVIADGKIASALSGKTYNGLTLTPAATGFTIAGGTTSKTLTVPLDASVSGTNTGDQTITLTGDVTGSGTGSFATAIGTGKVTNAMLAGSIDLTTKVTGVLPVANGGTNSTATPTDGGIAYGDGTAVQYTAQGTTGQVLQSAGTGIPVWVESGTMMLSGMSNNTSVSNTTLYFPIIGGVTGSTTDAQAGIRTLMSRTGTIKNFYVKLSAALASGKTGSVTVYKNGVATSLAATLTVGPTLFSDLTDAVTVVAGDEVGIKITTTGNVKFSWAADFVY